MRIPWSVIFEVIEGYTSAQKIHALWRFRPAIERYVSTMSFSTSSVARTNSHPAHPHQKQLRDAYAVRILELMDETLSDLSVQDQKTWKWRYREYMPLELIGQFLYDAPKDCQDISGFFRVKALRSLDSIATKLARTMACDD